MKPNIKESLFIRALKREPVPRTPVWFMRQAGRYLPEYRAVRAKITDFMQLCKTPELACEVTLQPLRRFPLDAAILFSDILTIPDAMGLGLFFAEGEGPRFQKPLHNLEAIHALRLPCIEEDLSYVMEAAQLIRHELPGNIPLIGFSGSPWTLGCYMVEGQSNPGFPRMKALIEKEPQTAKHLLSLLTQSVADYLLLQIHAGVNAVMLFDTWGGLLSTTDYLTYSLPYMEQIVAFLKQKAPETPIILFTKKSKPWLCEMADTGCDAISLDWTVDLHQARMLVGNRVALQGNLNPQILLTDAKTIEENVGHVLAAYGKGEGHIFNLGHGITPDVPPENVAIMVNAVIQQSPSFHQD